MARQQGLALALAGNAICRQLMGIAGTPYFGINRGLGIVCLSGRESEPCCRKTWPLRCLTEFGIEPDRKAQGLLGLSLSVPTAMKATEGRGEG